MAHDHYMPTDDLGKGKWLNTFAKALNTYATTLGIPTTTVTQYANDATNFNAVLSYADQVDAYGQQVTGFKNVLRDGVTAPAPGATAATTLATPPAPPTFTNLQPDIIGRVLLQVQTIKGNPNYNDDVIGKALGVIGAETTLSPVDKASLQPDLKDTLQSGHPQLKWIKGQAHSLKIMVDRGTGTFVLLTISTTNNYTDKFDLPAAGTSAVWKYKAIYLEADEEMGLWSKVVAVTVMG